MVIKTTDYARAAKRVGGLLALAIAAAAPAAAQTPAPPPSPLPARTLMPTSVPAPAPATGAPATTAPASNEPAPAKPKTIVRSADDLPRYTYPLAGSATALLASDAATFNAFAAGVKADTERTLAAYDIEDHATLRDLLGTEIAIDVLSGAPDSAITPLLAQVRAAEDKPDARALSGLRTQAVLTARMQAGSTSGPAYQSAFERAYAAGLAALPWSVVGTALKETKSGFELLAAPVVVGQVTAGVDPAVAKTHAVSGDVAAALIGARYTLDVLVPLKAQILAAVDPLVARNSVLKPDIWAARDITLTAKQRLTPVRIGVWDSGSDITLFPHQLYTDPAATINPHGFAYDLFSLPTAGVLYPLSALERAQYPQYAGYFEGLSDLQSSIGSPEAAAVRQKIATLSSAETGPFLQNLELFGNYAHGTHVSGLALRGNPAARLVVGRITYDYKTIPTPPTDAIMQQTAVADRNAVRYFRTHHVRVVNMSWGDSPADYESTLERNGIGKNATERKALARRYFTIERDALYAAIKAAPDVLFVCAAGNEDSDAGFGEFIPSSFDLPNLLVVAAVDQAGDETSFTSYGKTVKVDADGYHVPSTVPGGRIVKLSGTSMASPNTANLAGKLLALDPKLTPTQVIALIRDGATTTSDGRRHLIDPKRSVALLAARMRAAHT